MNGNESIRKIAFEENLAYFKRDVKDFFATYKNQSGGEDCIEICLIRSGYRTVLKAEEIINRQKAEIERLDREVDRLSQCVLYHDGQIVDAIKDFAERVKKHFSRKYSSFLWGLMCNDINDLVKELTEDGTE